jgi:hypothetical protein
VVGRWRKQRSHESRDGFDTPKPHQGGRLLPEELAPPTNENCYFSSYSGGVNYQGGTTPQAAVTWWIDDPAHRNTLLDPEYRESGVAVV